MFLEVLLEHSAVVSLIVEEGGGGGVDIFVTHHCIQFGAEDETAAIYTLVYPCQVS